MAVQGEKGDIFFPFIVWSLRIKHQFFKGTVSKAQLHYFTCSTCDLLLMESQNDVSTAYEMQSQVSKANCY